MSPFSHPSIATSATKRPWDPRKREREGRGEREMFFCLLTVSATKHIMLLYIFGSSVTEMNIKLYGLLFSLTLYVCVCVCECVCQR